MDATNETIQQLVAAMRAVSSTPNAQLGQGAAGLFSYPGLEPNVVNAASMPQLGLLDLLPSRTANVLNPLYGIVTGVTDTTGAEPTGPCDDLPQAGLMQMCTTAAWWGYWGLATRVYDIKQAGLVDGRSQFNDLSLIGGSDSSGQLVPTIPGAAGNPLRAEAAKLRQEFAISWARRWTSVLWEGNPANNTSGGGYMEPYGLDTLINTGYQDAVSGTACAAADSLIVDAAGLDIEDNGGTVVKQINEIAKYLEHVARITGLDPTTWVLAMREEFFSTLVEYWPCAYYTTHCGDSDGSRLDGAKLADERDKMIAGQYLKVNGKQIKVVFDNGLPMEAVDGETGTYETDIAFVPLRVLGNTPVTYIEYFNWNGPNAAMEMAKLMAPDGHYFTSNGGRFLWEKKNPTNGCVQAQAWTRWRVALRTPHLAARYTNLRWTPIQTWRGLQPGDLNYVSGGSTAGQAAPTYYPPTA